MKVFDVVQIRNVCWTWGHAEMMIIHVFCWVIWLKRSIRFIEVATKWEYVMLRWVDKILLKKKREHQFPCMSTVWVEHLLTWDRILLEREREHQFPCMGTIWIGQWRRIVEMRPRIAPIPVHWFGIDLNWTACKYCYYSRRNPVGYRGVGRLKFSVTDWRD